MAAGSRAPKAGADDKAAKAGAAQAGAANAKPAKAKTPAKGTTAAAAKSAKGVAALPVRAGDDPWSPAELAEIRQELETDIARLRHEVAEAESMRADTLRDSGEGSGDDQADVGSKNFEREHELSVVRNARDLLAQSERALLRIDNETYGTCESCGSGIGKMRLQAFPRATLCVTCKAREERR